MPKIYRCDRLRTTGIVTTPATVPINTIDAAFSGHASNFSFSRKLVIGAGIAPIKIMIASVVLTSANWTRSYPFSIGAQPVYRK